MPSPVPFVQLLRQQSNFLPSTALLPTLHLYPLNDTWALKHVTLTNLHAKIRQQARSKMVSGEQSGFFDGKVLCRQHAEVWEEGGKGIKSPNGTFIYSERTSNEGHKADPFETKNDNVIEFGIDISGRDNKTIIHHKVAAHVMCMFTEQDAQVAA
ncbi:hypothetical protein CVT25_009527 [Psilocybe cyanescens]|uniref:Uncharacterized protein n=1 Tax=Psilocybe cyanescens TaxID=93625 RepID=A0A409XGN6_PSICY|nr:hypothetical protein CVT25_009527 [Psilocybe cyanescens]